MKKFNKLFVIGITLVVLFSLTACKKDNKKEEKTTSDYSEYVGYQFAGKDPWGSELAITVRSIENGKITWTYTDVLGTGESAVTAYSELTTDFSDNTTSFTTSGKGDKEGYTFEYAGTLTLNDGKLTVKLTNGSLTEESTEGGSAAYQVGPLDENAKTITLTKVVDNN